MASKDLHHGIEHLFLTDSTIPGGGPGSVQTSFAEMTGFEGLEFLFTARNGSGTPFIVVITPQESDDNVSYANVDPKFILGNVPLTLDFTKQLERFGYIGEKKFVRALLTPQSGIVTDTLKVTGIGIKGFPTSSPTPNPS